MCRKGSFIRVAVFIGLRIESSDGNWFQVLLGTEFPQSLTGKPRVGFEPTCPSRFSPIGAGLNRSKGTALQGRHVRPNSVTGAHLSSDSYYVGRAPYKRTDRIAIG